MQTRVHRVVSCLSFALCALSLELAHALSVPVAGPRRVQALFPQTKEGDVGPDSMRTQARRTTEIVK